MRPVLSQGASDELRLSVGCRRISPMWREASAPGAYIMKMSRAASVSILLLAALTAGAAASSEQLLGVSVFGNDHTNNELLLNVFGLRTGNRYTRVEIDEGLERIETLSGIKSAYTRTVRNEGDDGIHLIIVVTEEDTRSIKPLVMRPFSNKIAFGAVFEESNFRGWNERLRFSALFRGSTILTGSWRKPYFLGNPVLGIGARARYRYYSYPFPDFQDLFVDDDISWLEAAASFNVHPTDYLTISLSPGVDRIRLADSMLVGQGNDDIPPAPSGTFATFETRIEIDRLDREFYPRNGLKITAFRKDYGVLQSDAEMKNFYYRFRGLFFLNLGRALLSLDTRAMFVHGRTPIILVQHLGGVSSIRGYDFGVLSGDNRILGRTELRIPLNFDDIDDLGNPMILVDFNIFLDSGACWRRGESLDTDLFHSGFGFGLNFIPVENGLIKIGYAWRLETSGTFYFDVGTMF
jgi:outer membrane protein assembly factor BamA